MSMTPSLEFMLTIFLVAAVVSDFADHRIPNMITGFAIVVGIASHLYLGGLQGAAFALTGFALGMGCLLPLYALGGMGAGDVKLMGAIGAFVGPSATLLAVAVALICGAFGAIGWLLWSSVRGHEISKAEPVIDRLHGPLDTGGGVLSTHVGRKVRKARFPYALALASGGVASLVYLRF